MAALPVATVVGWKRKRKARERWQKKFHGDGCGCGRAGSCAGRERESLPERMAGGRTGLESSWVLENGGSDKGRDMNGSYIPRGQ